MMHSFQLQEKYKYLKIVACAYMQPLFCAGHRKLSGTLVSITITEGHMTHFRSKVWRKFNDKL